MDNLTKPYKDELLLDPFVQGDVLIFLYQPFWKWFSVIGGVLLIALFAWVGWLPFQKYVSLWHTLFMLSLSIGMIVAMSIGVLEFIRGKIELTRDSLKYTNWRKIYVIHSDQIESVQMLKGYLRLNMKPGVAPKKLDISVYFVGISVITNWVSEQAKNLDFEQIVAEENEVLSDESLGVTKEQREEVVSSAYRTFGYLEKVAYALFLWGLIFPGFNYRYLMYLLIGFPVLLFGALVLHKGAVHIDGRKESKVAKLSISLIFVGLVLTLRAFFDYPLLNYVDTLIPFIVLTIILCVASLNFVRLPKDNKVGGIVGLIFSFSIYSYGAVVSINCLLGERDYLPYKAKILEKRVESGRHTSYYLKVEPWEKSIEPSEVSVDKNLYNEINAGETLEIRIRKGYLGIDWLSYIKG